jgi:hypothetical protein
VEETTEGTLEEVLEDVLVDTLDDTPRRHPWPILEFQQEYCVDICKGMGNNVKNCLDQLI